MRRGHQPSAQPARATPSSGDGGPGRRRPGPQQRNPGVRRKKKAVAPTPSSSPLSQCRCSALRRAALAFCAHLRQHARLVSSGASRAPPGIVVRSRASPAKSAKAGAPPDNSLRLENPRVVSDLPSPSPRLTVHRSTASPTTRTRPVPPCRAHAELAASAAARTVLARPEPHHAIVVAGVPAGWQVRAAAARSTHACGFPLCSKVGPACQ